MRGRTAALAVVAATGLVAAGARADAPAPTFIQIVQPAEGERVHSIVPLVELIGAAGAGPRIQDNVVVALDISHSTFMPSGVDVDDDVVVGTLRFTESQINSGRLDSSYLKWTSDYDDTVIEASLEAARTLLRNLDPVTSRAALVTFRGDGTVKAPLGPPSAALAALDDLPPRAEPTGTNLEDAVLEAIKLLTPPEGSAEERNVRRTVLVLSDGDPTVYNASMRSRYEEVSVTNRRARRAALRAAQRAAEQGVRIDGYAFGAKRDKLKAFREVVEVAGGYYYAVETPGDVHFAHDPPELEGLAGVEIRNLTSQAPARAVRTFRDGSFDAYVPLQAGRNLIEIRARLNDGTALRAVREVTYEPPPRPSPQDMATAELLREAVAERTRETELVKDVRERRPPRQRLKVEVDE